MKISNPFFRITRSQPVAGPQIMVVLSCECTQVVGQKLHKENEGKKEGNKHKKGRLTEPSQAASDTKLLWV